MLDLARRKGHTKFSVLLKANMPACYTEPHPYGSVMMPTIIAQQLADLLNSQPYISSCNLWAGEQVDYDMDLFRFCGLNTALGHIGTWYTAVHYCTPDFTQPWLYFHDVEPSGKVLVCRSGRYRNRGVTYPPGIGNFVGYEKENETGLPYIDTPTILDLAREIAACKLLIANQTFGFALGAALDVPRILEVCPTCPNVHADTRNCTLTWNTAQMVEACKDHGLIA